MSRSMVAIFSLVSASSQLPACADSYCLDSEHPERLTEARCQPKQDMDSPSAAFEVKPRRIPISKDSMVELEIDAGIEWAGKSVSLKQGTIEYTVGNLDKDGKFKKQLQAAALPMKPGNFVPGPATVAIMDKKETVDVRLHVIPSFSTPSNAYGVSGDCAACNPPTITAYTASLGVFSKSILAVNYYDETAAIKKQDIRTYSFNSGGNVVPGISLAAGGTRFSSAGDPPVGIAVTDAAFYVADNDSSFFRITTCTDPMRSNSCTTARAGNLTSVVSFSSSVRGAKKYFAGIFNTGPSVFSQSSLLGPSLIQLTGNDPNKGMSGSIAVVGDFNGDSNSDVIIWYGNSLSVYITPASMQSLEYNSTYSMALQNAQQTTAGVNPSAVSVGDVDGDGLDDIVIAKDDKIAILINEGNANFSLSSTISVTTMTGITAMTIGDVTTNGTSDQGINDIVIGSQSKKTIAVIENKATY